MGLHCPIFGGNAATLQHSAALESADLKPLSGTLSSFGRGPNLLQPAFDGPENSAGGDY